MKENKTEKIQSAWHDQSQEAILQTLDATPDGLSQGEAEKRLETYGPNRLPEPPKPTSIVRFLLQFHNLLIYILIATSFITAFLNHWVDTIVIIAVVVSNAIIGFIQERKAEKAMDAIREMLAPQASVLRDGERRSIDGEALVPGDIVLLQAGDKVPADLRLISTHGLSIQESILTGESVPVEKNIEPVEKNAPLGDRFSMAFSGTLITNGQGKGVVVATGENTEIGRISGMLSRVETLTTPFIKQVEVFTKWLAAVILLVAILLMIYGYYVGHQDLAMLLMIVVGLSVAAIPEVLPPIITITLAIGVQAMAKHNAIVRRLPAIETLGSVSIICTDKTGTLTRNEMMVASVLVNRQTFILEGNGYESKGAIRLDGNLIDPSEYPNLTELALSAILCNNSSLREHEGNWVVEGDPMEGALLTFFNKVGRDIFEEQGAWSHIDTIPFDPTNRYMATLHHDQKSQAFVFVKGSPEKILSMCSDERTSDGQTGPLQTDYWNNKADDIAAQGQRVLAFAVRPMNSQHEKLDNSDLEGNLTLLGMIGLIDPPREEVLAAIAECQSAGIRVKMITGDHAKTAIAIAKQVGLENPDFVLTGVDFDNMNDAEFKKSVLECNVFARTSPEHKLRLVMALQSYNMTVAMTGDGVNDAPALKRADVGIAMGKRGSEVAKESSELMLTDDNFASIVEAVREGRTVYNNITKVISWCLPTNSGEALAIIVALLFNIIQPVTPIQILWVNLITTVCLGLPLAFEPTEENTMKKPPHARNHPLVSGGLLWHIILVSLLFLCGIFGIFNYAIHRGYSIEHARTMALNTIVVLEIFHLLFIRNINNATLTWKSMRGTKILWAAIVIIIIVQLAITYLPPLQTLFATRSISLFDAMIVVGIGVALFIIIETEKRLRLFYSRG